ncbi:ICE-like protease (caspase) p20 domain protein [Rhizoctonia solani 123E]|uniref:ICE-like protease (Caspase) p20 domain protein n=1 Tax=Rhizoctonia solani 123E TaxID=1423351 RepID=A0A074RMI2_9AGAM|nr:ICE-like protease (caspase) p20 domain protein [Rhizoctonia solani 123E]
MEFDQIEVAMADGDNLPNTTVSLGAKVKRRALLIGVQYEADRRFTGGPSLYMLATPRDVLAVYRMLLDRGYEAHNIRILVEGVVKDPLSHPTRRNIIDSLKWLFDSAEPGDYRYFHFSGHGHAYEVEGGQGKTAKIKPVVSAPVEYLNSSPLTGGEGSNWSAAKSQVKFYREALLTEWSYTPWEDMLKMQTKGSLRLDAYTRISDEEFNAMIAKLPKGCVLTVCAVCITSLFRKIVLTRFQDTHRVPTGLGYRGGVSGPAIESEEGQFITDPSKLCPNDSPRNLFVPPVFYLHSEFRFNPKIMMERVRGPNPFSGVQATVVCYPKPCPKILTRPFIR